MRAGSTWRNMSFFNIDLNLILFRLKLTSAILSFVFGGLAVYFIVQFQKLVGLKAQMAKLALRIPKAASGGGSLSKWEEIMRHMGSDREAEWKFAIIEADKLVDDLLRTASYPGDTMGERLMNIEKGQFLSLEGLWEAHKIRNKLAHDVNYFLRYAEARRAIQLYENTLRELGLI